MIADPGIRIHSAAPHNLDPFSLLQAVKLARPKLDEEVVIAIKACADSRGKREREVQFNGPQKRENHRDGRSSSQDQNIVESSYMKLKIFIKTLFKMCKV